jgi:CDP-6-deoxy-D-xylo-4-hexulose-3-dehydrase
MPSSAGQEKVFEAAAEFFASKPLAQIIPGQDYIPSSGKVLDVEDLQALMAAVLDLGLTSGRFAEQFENEFSVFMGSQYCLLTNSGSSANLLAMSALTSPMLGQRQLRPGDEVITAAAGFPTTVNPIFQVGCCPVFVDVNLGNLGVQVAQLEAALSSKTRAVMLAHTLGNPFEIEIVKQFCDQHGLWLIEDCCDALGACFGNKKVGSFGDLATVSFYPAHHMTMGEGGAVLTSNHLLKRAVQSFRDWGRDCWCPTGVDNACGKRFEWQMGNLPEGYDHKYIYSHIGFNMKVTEMQAALGCSQLKKLIEFIRKRNENAKTLRALIESKLSNWQELLLLPGVSADSLPSWFGFPIILKNQNCRNTVLFLEKNKIGTRPIFAGNLLQQPLYFEKEYRVVGELKNSDILMRQAFWVGVYPALGSEHMEYISDKLVEALT